MQSQGQQRDKCSKLTVVVARLKGVDEEAATQEATLKQGALEQSNSYCRATLCNPIISPVLAARVAVADRVCCHSVI